MSYYSDIYSLRLNRFGNTPQSRIDGQRAYEFEEYLNKSIYRVDFVYNAATQPAILEPHKQDQSQTVMYLLTRHDLQLPAGTILDITANGETNHWIVWWNVFDVSEGYNRHIALKANYQLTWKHNGVTQTQWVFFCGPAMTKIKDTIKSQSGASVFQQDENMYLFVTPWNSNVSIDDYFEITCGTVAQGFMVSEFDICSTPGLGYISARPYHIKDQSPQSQGTGANYYWINGGLTNGNS